MGGLAAVTTGILFALSLFFIPLVEPLRQLRFAYGPALDSIRKIDFDDLTELVPAFVTMIMMIFSYHIAGRGRALLCLVYYVFGLPH